MDIEIGMGFDVKATTTMITTKCLVTDTAMYSARGGGRVFPRRCVAAAVALSLPEM